MKKYGVTLSIGLTTYIEADYWVKDENMLWFVRGGRETAVYFLRTITKVEDCTKGHPCEPDYQAAG